MQFTTPTPIQAQAIPPALEGCDILGSAQTGTGKTGAFGIPLVTKLLVEPNGSALVMTPTRELATQVLVQLQAMIGKSSKIRTALLIGGEPMPKQFNQLRNKPRLIVGTPGRINDHLERGTLKLNDTGFLVLDETDRMLDMGFTIQIERIMGYMPKQRQTLLFSATLPKNIVKIAEKYLHKPVRVAADAESSAAINIKQETIHLSEGEKYPRFLEELEAREGSIIVFVKTKFGTERMATKLVKAGHSADAIHGDLRQNKRDKVIANFRNKKHRILVATDVAARGLDIPHIEHVINYDLPQCAEDYIHRIGRTARAGAEGAALCFVTPADRGKWRDIERLLDPTQENGPSDSRGAKSASKKKKYGKGASGGRKSSSAGLEITPRRSESKSKPFKRDDEKRRDGKKPEGKKEGFRKGGDASKRREGGKEGPRDGSAPPKRQGAGGKPAGNKDKGKPKRFGGGGKGGRPNPKRAA